ncbi:MAG: sigma-54 dependent transcriptional regulator [Phycisphaerae bacterium]
MAEKIYQNVLIAKTDSQTTRVALEVLARRGIRGTVVGEWEPALEKIVSGDWDMALADAGSDDEALKFLLAAKAEMPELPVVMLGSGGSVRQAVRAVRAGCEDFLVKPVSPGTLATLFETLLPNRDVPLAAAAEGGSRCLYRIVGGSRELLEVMTVARKVAPTSVPVLITGESGTGKELISYYVHSNSSRAHGPYVRVNCAALSESLLESELFGHERGAFTGAYSQRKGRFERAHGGTLLLDEVSETTPRLQAELLRVLEQQDFERVGGSESVRVNVRVICTSNRDLALAVQQRRFRDDLYYRISGTCLTVPPLRRRTEDIQALVWHFVNLYAREVRRRIERLDEGLLKAFSRHSWPGNVRELRNVVRTALILGDGPTLSLAEGQRLGTGERAVGSSASLSLQELERRAIFEALRRTKSHQAKAARLLGITDRTLREKLRRYRRDGHFEPTGEMKWLVEST